jgi:hypothetical protein
MALRKKNTFALKTGRIGLISDTHGLMRPEALSALSNVELIIHAGDIGKSEILEALKTIAPVAAIRGNNDTAPWARELPQILDLQINNTNVRVLHNVREITDDPAAAGVQVVISGHSHKPSIETRGSALLVNPGSAGPRRFKLPITVGLLVLQKGDAKAEIIPLL